VNRLRRDYIKKLQPPAPRYIHVSCEARMIPNPLDPLAPPIPWVERPGFTLNIGRNADKRALREARKGGAF
jgi:hypothetical protein